MSRSAPAGVRTYLGSVSPALFAQLSHLCGSGKGRSPSRGRGFDVERRLALRPRRSNVRTTALVVVPTHVVNAADRGSASERAVWPRSVVVVEPVWQCSGALAV